MFSVDAHTPPALFPIIPVLHDVVASNVFHALSFAADAAVGHQQGVAEAQVKIFSMPVGWKQTSRTLNHQMDC